MNAHTQPAPALRPPARHEWLRRYGPAEALALLASLTAFLLIDAITQSRAAGAYAAALANSTCYYGFLVGRETGLGVGHARRLGGEAYGCRDAALGLRALLIEFGPAEALDVTIVRPSCTVLATGALGPAAGILAAKVVADLVFYVPVVSTCELHQTASLSILRTEHSRALPTRAAPHSTQPRRRKLRS